VARPGPRGRGPVRLPARHPRHPGGRRLKVPSLLGPAGAHIHGQAVLGVIVCGIAAYLSVRFLVRWFQTRTLTPFAIYCLAFGALSIIRFL
jgi:undecaprenyl-diphosphatase